MSRIRPDQTCRRMRPGRSERPEQFQRPFSSVFVETRSATASPFARRFGRSLAGRVSGQLPGREIVKLQDGKAALLVVDLAERLTVEEKFATLVHELAHVYCGHLVAPHGVWWPDRPLDLFHREFEAEAVSWIVCARRGLDPGSYRYLEGYLKPGARLPDVSLNQIMVAANYIEGLAGGRFYKKIRDGVAPPAGGTLAGIYSHNTGRPYNPEDQKLAAEIIKEVEAEQQHFGEL
jgi:hypothetical protein